MDPLSALSVAAAVIQFVDFGQRLLSTGWRVYRDVAGEGAELKMLSALTKDIDAVTTPIKDACVVLDTPGDQESNNDWGMVHERLRELCDECDKIAADISKVLPLTEGNLKRRMVKNESRGTSTLTDQHRSFTESFRAALVLVWHRGQIRETKERLSKIRANVMGQLTLLIWLETNGQRSWQNALNSKLDEMKRAMETQLATAQELGPRCNGHEGPQGPLATLPRPSPNAVIANKISQRIWERDWQPDDTIIEGSADSAFLSAEDITSTLMGWLRFETMEAREDGIVNPFHSTYNWILDSLPHKLPSGTTFESKLPSWLRCTDRTSQPFWITGKPGSGKSTMMKYIVRHDRTKEELRTWAGDHSLCVIRYYAWKPGIDLAKSITGLIRSILYQVTKEYPEVARKLVPRRWTLLYLASAYSTTVSPPPWHDWELFEALHSLLTLIQGRMKLVIFIDGLDEFGDSIDSEDGSEGLCQLVAMLAANESVKVCVASRPWRQFSDAFESSPTIEMHLVTQPDIFTYVSGQLRTLRAFKELSSQEDAGEALLEETAHRAEGVFLWVTLVTKTIAAEMKDGATLSDLWLVLRSMPPEIEDLYDAIYKTIPQRLRHHTAAMLMIFATSQPPTSGALIWLADEIKSASADMDATAMTPFAIISNLQRKLKARTRGILDVVGRTVSGVLPEEDEGSTSTQRIQSLFATPVYVEYLHRTAGDWLLQPRVLEQLSSDSPGDFDPFRCLYKAQAIVLQRKQDQSRLTGILKVPHGDLEVLLHYATHANINTDTSDVHFLKTLDQTFYPTEGSRAGGYVHGDSSTEDWFIGECGRYAIQPYIQYKFEQSWLKEPYWRTRQDILLRAVIQCSRWGTQDVIPPLEPRVGGLDRRQMLERRVQIIHYLLNRGVKPDRGLLETVEMIAADSNDPRNELQFMERVKAQLIPYYGLKGTMKRTWSRLTS